MTFPQNTKSAEEIAGGLPLHTLGCLRSPSGICVCIGKDLIAQALSNFAAGELEDRALRLEHLREAQSDSDLILLRQIVLNFRIRAKELRAGEE